MMILLVEMVRCFGPAHGLAFHLAFSPCHGVESPAGYVNGFRKRPRRPYGHVKLYPPVYRVF